MFGRSKRQWEQSGNEEELFIRMYKLLNGQENSFSFSLRQSDNIQ